MFFGQRGYSENAAAFEVHPSLSPLTKGERSTPSRSVGGGSPASAAMVGYKSTLSTRAFETTPPAWAGEEIRIGTRVPNSKFVCFPQMLC
jgi:hypothetical protein